MKDLKGFKLTVKGAFTDRNEPYSLMGRASTLFDSLNKLLSFEAFRENGDFFSSKMVCERGIKAYNPSCFKGYTGLSVMGNSLEGNRLPVTGILSKGYRGKKYNENYIKKSLHRVSIS